jgi:hypothetical protein
MSLKRATSRLQRPVGAFAGAGTEDGLEHPLRAVEWAFFPLRGGGLVPIPAASTFPLLRAAYYWSYRQGIQVYIEERP